MAWRTTAMVDCTSCLAVAACRDTDRKSQGMNITATLKRFMPARGEARGGETAPVAASDQDPASFGLRFRAWWEGASVQDVLAADTRRLADRGDAGEPGAMLELLETDAAAPPSAPIAEEVVPGGYWSSARIAVNEMLWGSGEIVPGGAARTIDLVGAFGLGSDVNVLQIGAGLGGAARTIAGEYGAWVTGFEADPALAIAAMAPQRMNMTVKESGTGLKKSKAKVSLADKARISQEDLENLSLKARAYDCAFARETLHRITNKEGLCEALFGALKPHASFLLTDIFVAEGAKNNPALQRWIDSERGEIHPWSLAEAKKMLTETGFDLRVIDNVTAQFRSDIFDGFAKFVSAHERARIPHELLEPLLEFAELWGRRVAALDAGVIEVYKLVALRTDM